MTQFIARDRMYGTDIGGPCTEAEANRAATAASVAAGERGQKVALSDGLDRFVVRAVPAAQAPARTYTALEAEAALCIHEAMLDARMGSTSPAITAAFDEGGSATMRHHALSLAPFVLAVHTALDADELPGGPYGYDHEIVPAILSTVRWAGCGYILPGVAEAARQAGEALQQG